MKTTSGFLLVIAIFWMGCQKNEFATRKDLTDGFCIMANDQVVLDHRDLEFYDYSSHLIYLKEHKSFAADIENIDDFQVFADKKRIYTGQTMPGYASFLPSGPIINTHPSGYGDFIVPIGLIPFMDAAGNKLPDLREDERIVKALRKYDQFHAGLSCEIRSVRYVSPDDVAVELLLKNNDPFNYYYLDPEKTGTGLFHYFTTGLSILDFKKNETYSHQMEIIPAEPWNTWSKDWLSVLKGKESKTILIRYNKFAETPPGEYKVTFEYPGLHAQVEKEDLFQEDGLIWLGSLRTVGAITIE